MSDNLKIVMKKKVAPILMAGVTGLATFSCSKKNNTYTLEQNSDEKNMYSVKSYNIDKLKNTPYEIKKIGKTYDTICTPIEFKNYTQEKNITWDDIKETVKNSKFDEYHKNIILKGIKNLKKNNFNMSLETLNYNIKKTNIEYVENFQEKNIVGAFDCFEHKITLTNKIKDKDKYEQVFLHEILGHGMTCAYIDESKVYCSIDIPTYIINNNKIKTYIIYGEPFNEALAQIISLTALDKKIKEDYKSEYDMNIVQLLMFCEDNNCKKEEYADYGINILAEKMKQNKIDNPTKLLELSTFNYSISTYKKELKMPTEILMYEYFCERINDSYTEGKTPTEIKTIIDKAFNSYNEYILTNKYNNEEFVDSNTDYIGITRLYNELGKYAYQNKPNQKTK